MGKLNKTGDNILYYVFVPFNSPMGKLNINRYRNLITKISSFQFPYG